MRKLAMCLLAGFVVVPVAAQEQDAMRAVVEKAIKAHGGADKLAKMKAVHAKLNGTLDFMAGAKFTMESLGQFPDKFKHVIDADINNMNISIIQVFDGKHFWINVMGKTVELDDAKLLDELKENIYVEKLGNLVGLTAKEIELAPLGEVKVTGQEAVGVRASSKGHRDVNLYFNKKTGLLAKSEWRTFDPLSKQEVSQEKLYSDYREVAGVQSPQHVVINHDGKRHVTVEITSLTFVDRHDDSVFAKP